MKRRTIIHIFLPLLCLLAIFTAGCAPERLVVLSDDESGITYVSQVLRLTSKDGVVEVLYERTKVGTDWWRPWPWRQNSREYVSVRYLPTGGEVRLVEVFDTIPTIGMYTGDFMVTHGDPLPGLNEWRPAGTTADNTDFAKVWHHVRTRLNEAKTSQ